MNTQEAFNLIWERAKIKKKAVETLEKGNLVCKYRAANGLPCFIGAIITDEEYHEDLEGRSISTLLREHMVDGIFNDIEEQFLTSMQAIHDVYSAELWEMELRNRALRFGLIVPGEG